ncbi:hypothetical protein IQ247_27050 [Plectonema cf. radiosum LEGE 06105]|uniref:Uncharacterized protein n=1 Tax=Plectonema cf. radiosum LEGE 06105 TaxID=945769 RepID=A0A8J7F4J0_9CYAN|nr:hypothetical protein [Plectonema radiosum]MBE9216276.1 hypothetical protein [Plectonema cf. radiosum LEGE 06105]
MDSAKKVVLQPSVWDTDNLGDLVAEGVLESDDISLHGVVQAQNEEYERLEREWQLKNEEYLNSIDWENVGVKSELANEEEEEVF